MFHLNNELAGYAAVLHALQLKGWTAHYGAPLKACVIGFGSVGRGAVHGLRGLGFRDVTLFHQRPGHTVGQPIPSLKHWQYARVGDTEECAVLLDSGPMPMPQALGHFDVIVNCVLQNTDRPQMYLRAAELDALRPGSLIVDVSCDEGMGFSFARPTQLRRPGVHRRRGHPVLRRRSHAVVPVGLGHPGDQHRAAPVPAHRHVRARSVDARLYDPARHRDP